MYESGVKLVIVAIILITRVTVLCVTSPNFSVPIFPTEHPQTGRGYSSGHGNYDTPYNNIYNTADNNDNIYNTIEYSENKLYSSLLNSGNNVFNTLDNNANNNMYNPSSDNTGESEGSSAANDFFNNYHHQDGQYQHQPPNVRPRKGYGYFPGYGGPYNQYYYQQGVPPNCFNDMASLFHIGTSKLGFLGFLKAGFTSLLSHVPYVLVKFIAKFALVKLGFLLLGIPLVIPLIVPLLSLYLPFLANKFSPCCGGDDDDYNNNTANVRFEGEDRPGGGGYEKAVGRAMKTLLDSERCYEKIACQLGKANAKSEYNRPIMWVMASMLKAGSEEERSRLWSFKDAYTRGNQEDSCGNEIYQCHFEKLAARFQ